MNTRCDQLGNEHRAEVAERAAARNPPRPPHLLGPHPPPLPPNPPSQPRACADFSLNNIKKVTAKRLQESKQTVPHFYLSVDVRMDTLMEVREKLKASSELKLTVNDFIVKAAALALMKVPEVNSAWMGDKVRRYKSVDMSIAVQTEHGLMVPIVRAADRKGLAAISADVKALAAKAKEGKLQPSEFVGGTFTISNLGMLGVKQFSAIVNPPQARERPRSMKRPAACTPLACTWETQHKCSTVI